MDALLIGFLVVAAAFIYFIPTITGWYKRHRDGIFILNLLLGWTAIGWIAAIIWAVSSPQKEAEWHYICPKCNYKNTLNQVVKVYVCPQCGTQTPIEEFERE